MYLQKPISCLLTLFKTSVFIHSQFKKVFIQLYIYVSFILPNNNINNNNNKKIEEEEEEEEEEKKKKRCTGINIIK